MKKSVNNITAWNVHSTFPSEKWNTRFPQHFKGIRSLRIPHENASIPPQPRIRYTAGRAAPRASLFKRAAFNGSLPRFLHQLGTSNLRLFVWFWLWRRKRAIMYSVPTHPTVGRQAGQQLLSLLLFCSGFLFTEKTSIFPSSTLSLSHSGL